MVPPCLARQPPGPLTPTAMLRRLVVRVTLDQRRRLIGDAHIAIHTLGSGENFGGGLPGWACSRGPNLPGGFRPRTFLRHSLWCCSIDVDYPRFTLAVKAVTPPVTPRCQLLPRAAWRGMIFTGGGLKPWSIVEQLSTASHRAVTFAAPLASRAQDWAYLYQRAPGLRQILAAPASGRPAPEFVPDCAGSR